MVLPSEIDVSRLRFMDTETTGLSSGAGTTIFLFGVGVVLNGVLQLDQFLLEDFPGEPLFLDLVAEAVGGDGVLVSYNGRAFDWNLFTTRSLINRRSPPEVGHIDLLYPVRRVYARSLADCRLSTLEAELLGIRRIGDIPGALIPDVYNRFLRFGEVADMERVVYHHAQDIYSLVTVLAVLEREAKSRLFGETGDSRANGARLLRLLVEGFHSRDQPTAAATALGRLQTIALAGGRDDGADEAAWYMAIHHRRRGETDDCIRMLSRLYREFGDLKAGRELAVQLEHRRRDTKAALVLVSELLETADDPLLRHDLSHRKLRLEVKLISSELPNARRPPAKR